MLLGLVRSFTIGGFIHVLVIAIVVIVIQVIRAGTVAMAPTSNAVPASGRRPNAIDFAVTGH